MEAELGNGIEVGVEGDGGDDDATDYSSIITQKCRKFRKLVATHTFLEVHECWSNFSSDGAAANNRAFDVALSMLASNGTVICNAGESGFFIPSFSFYVEKMSTTKFLQL